MGVLPNSPPQSTSIFQKTPTFQILDQACDGFVDFLGIIRMIPFKIGVLIPLVGVGALNETNSRFGETPCHQTLAAKVVGRLLVNSYNSRVDSDSPERSITSGASVCIWKASSKERILASNASSVSR